MLKQFYEFLDIFRDVNKFEDLKTDTDSLYLVLAEERLSGCKLPSNRAEWNMKRSKDCRDNFSADLKKKNPP